MLYVVNQRLPLIEQKKYRPMCVKDIVGNQGIVCNDISGICHGIKKNNRCILFGLI